MDAIAMYRYTATTCINKNKGTPELRSRAATVPMAIGHYATIELARTAYDKAVEIGLKEAKRYEELFIQLQKDNDIYIGYNYEGDTYGIYNDYMFIDFEAYGHNFTYHMKGD
jgi:hypothetical protein